MNERLENELLAAAKGGDAAAFQQVLIRHLPMLYAYSRALCGDHHAAQDVVQETGLIAFRNLNHLFPETDFVAWVKAIARRQALSMQRKLSRAAVLPEESIEAVYQDPSPAAAAPRRDALARCLGALQGRLARVIRDHYFGGSKVEELAQGMEMTRHAVVQLLYRARMALRDCIQRRLAREHSS